MDSYLLWHPRLDSGFLDPPGLDSSCLDATGLDSSVLDPPGLDSCFLEPPGVNSGLLGWIFVSWVGFWILASQRFPNAAVKSNNCRVPYSVYVLSVTEHLNKHRNNKSKILIMWGPSDRIIDLNQTH